MDLTTIHGVVPGKYVAAWPVFVVGDDPPGLSFRISVDDATHMGLGAEPALFVNEDEAVGRRQYITA